MKFLAITSLRDEGPHCLEWFAHHLAVGVEHFLVYSNDCTDGTDEILDLLAGAGIVTHTRLNPSDKHTVQWQALKNAASQEIYANADWVLVTDCDEFINLRPPIKNLADLVAAMPETTDAMAMPWRLFGSSGHVKMQDTFTTERFTLAAPTEICLPLAHFFKSLFRPSAFRQIGVHRPKRHKNKLPVWVDGGVNILPDAFAKADSRINLYGQPVSSKLVQLNHYSLRAAENFMVKRQRGLPNNTDRDFGLGYWIERNFNTEEDVTIQAMVPATRAKLQELMAIPGAPD
ncbi:MAG: glycosyltransferase family 2 protein, partial [Paracoccaceae bacterium]